MTVAARAGVGARGSWLAAAARGTIRAMIPPTRAALISFATAWSVSTAAAQPAAPSTSSATTAPAFPEREGGRVGLGLTLGLGSMVNAGTHPLVGVALRFGGAFTDRVHVLGEFALAASFGEATYYQAALDLGAQVYVLPKLYVRGGAGIKYDIASYGDSWPRQSNYPWLHLAGAVGWDLHRRSQRAASVELVLTKSLTDDQDFRWSPLEADPRYDLTVGVGLGLDWY